MAIIAEGRIVREGKPSDLINDLRGSVWVKTVERGEVEAHRNRHNVISSKLYAGRSILHVLSDTDPGDDFEPHEPDLEDVYFSTLQSANGNVAEAA
jgi:ABC-type multidrug transport system ATPase subunit